MKETSQSHKLTDRIRSWVNSKANGDTHRSSSRPEPDLLPISSRRDTSSQQSGSTAKKALGIANNSNDNNANNNTTYAQNDISNQDHDLIGGGATKAAEQGSGGVGNDANPPSTSPPQTSLEGTVLGAEGNSEKAQKNIFMRFLLTIKQILFYSKLNLMLVFVPVGIIVQEVPGTSPAIKFTMNALAIIPLAGLLSYATESVARRLGDSLGALLNVTFGNAVELIIFIIALVKDEIRIVQASLLGSILANLLLILGMAFFLGGLRFREQIYNSTVTQMSACLLSLSVISLVLPSAFHASFSDSSVADVESLKISRGTSVILLLVYIIYLMFQLMSHAYLYESTPQHIIDEESTPGPAAAWLDSSSSDSSSSSDPDSSDSDHSRETVSKRVRRVMRGQRRRKSSIISVDTSEGMASGTGHTRTPSIGTADASPMFDDVMAGESTARTRTYSKMSTGSALDGDEEAVEEEKPNRHKRRYKRSMKKHRKHKHHHHHRKSRRNGSHDAVGEKTIDENAATTNNPPTSPGEPRRVDFAIADPVEGTSEATGARRPFTGLRGMSLLPITKSLAPTVFLPPTEAAAAPAVPAGPIPRVRYGIRRTNSLPDRLHQYYRPPGAMMPSQIPLKAAVSGPLATEIEEHPDQLSRVSSVLLLLGSTALVAICAEFMVDSINGLVETSDIKPIFIGLIILPIVGNAAEHVTAITVAMKNKMDLAIGVAVGSSIQIALFITPLVVIIGWGMGKEMTLYFTLFETVCLFVSAFIVNFLVLDGRSNYLEGALLMATYVIIGVVAFFYPKGNDLSVLGGAE